MDTWIHWQQIGKAEMENDEEGFLLCICCVQSCALELKCVRYGKKHDRKTEGNGRRAGQLFVARNEYREAS